MSLATLAQYEAYLNVPSGPYDTYYQTLLDGATSVIENFCKRQFNYVTNLVEYYTTTGTRQIILKRTPVHSIASLYQDMYGYFNSSGSAFDSSSLLVAGQDYALQIDSPNNDGLSYSGIVVRINSVWPMREQVHQVGLLVNEVVPSYGNLKITYTAGYQTIPNDLISACCQIATLTGLLIKNVAPLESEGLGVAYHKYNWDIIAPKSTEALQLLGGVRFILSKYREVVW